MLSTTVKYAQSLSAANAVCAGIRAFATCSKGDIKTKNWIQEAEKLTKENLGKNKMFCFQCQETNRNTGCTVKGMCGKKHLTANIQDVLVQNVKELAQLCTENISNEDGLLIAKSLFMTITNANFDDEVLSKQIDLIVERKSQLLKEKGICADKIKAPLGVLSEKDENIRSLKEIITYGIKGSCAYIEHAAMIGKEDNELYKSIVSTLSQISHDMSVEDLIALTLKTGEICTKSMALLDAANTGAFGNPEISKVNIGVGKRPGILVSGHDLRDLLELLEQTKDSGIDIYTHGEMLPAHYYPALKKYPHLVGNYGGAWYAQDKEFPTFNGPILMTTNCIVPLQKSYADRIFTTGAVGYPGVPHIADRANGKPKDFSKIIELAKKCQPPTQIESGTIVGGFGHAQIFQVMPKVIEAIKAGKIKRFVVMSGCDGRHKSREYFTEIAKSLPKDTVILTSGCAKYRFIKLDLGDIDGIPRVLDAGQCNDSYSLAVVAMQLQKELGLDNVNKLPLYFDVGWYEQKAVCVLLALLSLGFKNVRIGPTLPAFVSPGVLDVLVKEFGLQCTETVEKDLKKFTQ